MARMYSRTRLTRAVRSAKARVELHHRRVDIVLLHIVWNIGVLMEETPCGVRSN